MKKQLFAIGSSFAVLSLIATPALASHGFGEFDFVGYFRGGAMVVNKNNATVVNDVTAIADTGHNTATGGSVDADAGDGGDVSEAEDANTGGAGGDAGNAGDGGNIITGDAIATADVTNIVNENLTEIVEEENVNETPDEYYYYEEWDDTICEDCESYEGFVEESWRNYPKKAPRVINRNNAEVANVVYAEAFTGDNEANGGSVMGEAGEGGDVKNAEDCNEGGEGGSLGEAGWGGNITTGAADSLSRVVNRINNSITRVRF